MKKFGFATMIASGLAAAVLGFAGPAQADSIHNPCGHSTLSVWMDLKRRIPKSSRVG